MRPEYLVFAIVAGIIIVGFGGELFFKKTGIPSFLFLIFIGVLLGPVLGIFPSQGLLSVLGIVSALTLIMVLFYSGIGINIGAVVAGGGRALLQTTLYVIPSAIVIGYVGHLLFHWELIQSLIFGSMIGGETTAAVIIPLARSLNLEPKTTTFLALESVMNSIYSIVMFFTFLGIYQTGTADIMTAISSIASQFSIGIVVGGILSFALLFALEYFKERTYTYVLTLGFLFGTCSLSNAIGGSGILSALIFGITLGNYKIINNVMHREMLNIDTLQKQLTTFQGEITFLLETFFFVFLGLIFQIKVSGIFTSLTTGLLFLAILLAFRAAASFMSTHGSDLYKNRYKILLMCAQGLTPATLAVIAVNSNLPLGEVFLSLVTYVIILTNVVNTAGSFWIARQTRSTSKS